MPNNLAKLIKLAFKGLLKVEKSISIRDFKDINNYKGAIFLIAFFFFLYYTFLIYRLISFYCLNIKIRFRV